MEENKQNKKPRQKRVTLSKLEKEARKINTYSTFVIDPETNLVLKYYEKFDEDKIELLLEEAYRNVSYAEEQGYDFFRNDSEFLKYIHFLIIKYFTHFENEITATFEDHVEAMRYLVSTGLFRVCFEDVFDGNEVMKVLDRLDEMQSVMNRIIDEENLLRNEIKENVKNPEILKVKADADATVPKSE